MFSFAFIFLCIQACLLQTVFTQCSCGSNLNVGSLNAAPLSLGGLGCSGLGSYSGPSYPGSYGYSGASAGGVLGSGQGVVEVGGELPVSGLTTVLGSAPTQGVVTFSGSLPAAGQVAITGKCGCSCGY